MENIMKFKAILLIILSCISALKALDDAADRKNFNEAGKRYNNTFLPKVQKFANELFADLDAIKSDMDKAFTNIEKAKLPDWQTFSTEKANFQHAYDAFMKSFLGNCKSDLAKCAP